MLGMCLKPFSRLWGKMGSWSGTINNNCWGWKQPLIRKSNNNLEDRAILHSGMLLIWETSDETCVFKISCWVECLDSLIFWARPNLFLVSQTLFWDTFMKWSYIWKSHRTDFTFLFHFKISRHNSPPFLTCKTSPSLDQCVSNFPKTIIFFW